MSSGGAPTKSAGMADPTLTNADMQRYKVDRARMFKGTITVCVIYGVFTLGILALVMLTETGRNLFAGVMLPFTVTFIGSMSMVLILLIIQVTTFKPVHIKNVDLSAMECPDYWKMAPVDWSTLSNLVDPSKEMWLKYKCVPDTNVFQSFGSSNIIDTASQSLGLQQSLSNYHVSVAGAAANPGVFQCGELIYPSLLANMDERAFPDMPNQMRCAIAEKCGFSWSSVC